MAIHLIITDADLDDDITLHGISQEHTPQLYELVINANPNNNPICVIHAEKSVNMREKFMERVKNQVSYKRDRTFLLKYYVELERSIFGASIHWKDEEEVMQFKQLLMGQHPEVYATVGKKP